MEHPGRIWNSIESRINSLLSLFLSAAVIRWLWVLLHAWLVACCGLFTILGLALGSAVFVHTVAKLYEEKPIHVAADRIDPANDGRLIRISGMLTSAHPARDPITGVQADGIRLERSTRIIQKPCGSISCDNVIFEELKAENFFAPELRVGAFTLSNYHDELKWYGDKMENAPLTAGTPAKGYTVSATPAPGLTDKTQPEVFEVRHDSWALPCCAWYNVYTYGTLYLTGRQVGNKIDFSDQAASIYLHTPHFWNSDTEQSSYYMEMIQVPSIILCIGYVATLFILGSLRSGLWHASGGRELIRLPLAQAALLLELCIFCTATALFGCECLARLTTPLPVIGSGLLALALFGYTLRRWLSLRQPR